MSEIWNEKDKKDFESIGIIFDFFYKTSSNENIEFVQYVFLKLYKNNHIFRRTVVQFFCTFDNKYFLIDMLLADAHFVMQKTSIQICANLVEGFQKKFLNPKVCYLWKYPIKERKYSLFF